MNKAEPPDDLTRTQREILGAIRELMQKLGHAPSMREVATKIDYRSTGGLSYQYRELEAKGYLRWEARRARTVQVRLPGEPAFPSEPAFPAAAGEPPQLLEPARPTSGETPGDAGSGDVIRVPVLGRIAAGDPILAEQSEEGHFLPLPREVVGGEADLFILEVVGDSMIGVGIFPGDWVVVRRLFQAPQNGDIVAATIDGVELEGTVKTYKKVGRHVWLMPQNPAYTPIPGDKAQFAGKVVAVLRRV